MISPGRLPRTTSPTKLGPRSAASMKFVISCAKPPRPKTTRNGKIFIEGFRDWIFEALVRRHESACHRRSNPKSVRNAGKLTASEKQPACSLRVKQVLPVRKTERGRERSAYGAEQKLTWDRLLLALPLNSHSGAGRAT